MSQYRRGADFERLVRSDLERRGYLAVRAAGSKGAAADGAKIDIVALYPSICDDAFFAGQPLRCQCKDRLLVQCKLSGVVSLVDKNRLVHAAEKYGCAPVIASKTEQGIKYDRVSLQRPTPQLLDHGAFTTEPWLLSPPSGDIGCCGDQKTCAHGVLGEEERRRKHQRTGSTKWSAYSIAGVSSFQSPPSPTFELFALRQRGYRCHL